EDDVVVPGREVLALRGYAPLVTCHDLQATERYWPRHLSIRRSWMDVQVGDGAEFGQRDRRRTVAQTAVAFAVEVTPGVIERGVSAGRRVRSSGDTARVTDKMTLDHQDEGDRVGVSRLGVAGGDGAHRQHMRRHDGGRPLDGVVTVRLHDVVGYC